MQIVLLSLVLCSDPIYAAYLGWLISAAQVYIHRQTERQTDSAKYRTVRRQRDRRSDRQMFPHTYLQYIRQTGRTHRQERPTGQQIGQYVSVLYCKIFRSKFEKLNTLLTRTPLNNKRSYQPPPKKDNPA
jgi:hypothetical protein